MAPRLGMELEQRPMAPAMVVAEAQRAGATSIAYTYVEPTVFLEYALDDGRLAREAGLRNLFITDGYATPEAIGLLAGVLDAANVDLKSFDDAFYRRLCGARLAHVLEAIEAYHAAGTWLELTTLVIPGHNDSDAELRALTGWIVERLGPACRGTSRASTRHTACRMSPRHRSGRCSGRPRSGARPACSMSTWAMRRSSGGGHALSRVWSRRRGAAGIPKPGPASSRAVGARAAVGRSRGSGSERGHERRRHEPRAGPAGGGGRELLPVVPRAARRAGRRAVRGRLAAARRAVRGIGPPPLGLLVRTRGSCTRACRPPPGGRPCRLRPRTTMHRRRGRPGLTVVILGTNHGAGWLDGVGAWDRGPWVTPADLVQVDDALTAEVVALGEPFTADPAAHIGEHSIEVQLPLLAVASPGARIVALAVASGTGERAVEAGERLGRLLAARRHAGDTVVLAISSDMAHYPAAAACEAVTERLWPAIAAVDPVRLAHEEAAVRVAGIPGVACGMCGIEPAVLGLAALRAMGASRGTLLAASTSADAGGPPDRTVGYLAVRFDA